MNLGPRLRGVDDDDVVRCDTTQVDLVRGESLPAPEPPAGGPRSRTVLFEQLEQLSHVGATETLLSFKRQLEQSGLKMACKQKQVVGVDEAFLRIGAQEVFRMADHELVERRARGHEYADRA